MEQMTRKEAYQILDRFRTWNHGQKSVGHAFGGPRTSEDDILDARRKLIKTAYDRLNDETPDE